MIIVVHSAQHPNAIHVKTNNELGICNYYYILVQIHLRKVKRNNASALYSRNGTCTWCLRIGADSPQLNLVLATKQAEEQGDWADDESNDGLEDEGTLHVLGRVGIFAGCQGVADNNKDGTEELATSPGHNGSHLGAERMAEFSKEFQGNGHEGKTGSTKNGEDDVWASNTAAVFGLGHPDKDEVADTDDGDESFESQDKSLVAIENGRRNGGRDETDDNEDGTADTSLILGEAVRKHHLVEERRERVEEADIDPEGDKNEPELERLDDGTNRVAEMQLGGLRRWANGRRRFARDEEGRDTGNS